MAKKAINEFMNDLTGDDMDMLEQIISLQYRKFIRFYKVVEEYSGLISKMQYEFNSPTSLDISLSLNTKRSLEKIKDDMNSLMEKKKYDGNVSVNKKHIYISIILEEK